MEKTNKRSLAYQLATTIRLDALESICGGHAKAIFSPSIHITNGYGGHPDLVYD